MDPFMGQIMQVGFSFAPQYWSTCQGQIMAVSQNSALFSLLGTTYGGNGSTTFGLPDAQGRTFIGTGQGPGLPNFVWGQIGGTPSVTLNTSQLPPHVHQLGAPNVTASLQAVTDNSLANTIETPEAGARLGSVLDSSSSATPLIYVPSTFTGNAVNLAGVQISGTTGIMGSGMPVPTLPPYLAVTTIIAVQGIYPSRP